MEIIEGKVSNYKGHGDIHRFYGKIGEEIKYYFLILVRFQMEI